MQGKKRVVWQFFNCAKMNVVLEIHVPLAEAKIIGCAIYQGNPKRLSSFFFFTLINTIH